MANISLTLNCNRNCSYCFANSVKAQYENEFMPFPIYKNILHVLKRSKIKHVRLLGGEPTLHPEFQFFVERAIEEGFQILIFSNGLISEELLYYLKKIERNKLSLLVNVNYPEEQSSREIEILSRTLKSLGNIITPGFNIHTSMPDLSFLIDLIEEYKLNNSVRLGLAHPCLDFPNSFLNPKDYIQAGHSIAEFALIAEKSNISLKFDCGFAPCMFPEGFLKRFYNHPVPIGLHCGPMPDILPDGSVVSCYTLSSRWSVPLDKELDIKEHQEKLNKILKPYRFLGVFRKCKSCKWYKIGYCNGGCLSASMKRLRSSGFSYCVGQNNFHTFFKEMVENCKNNSLSEGSIL